MSESTGKKLISQLKIIHPNEIKIKEIPLIKLWYIFLKDQFYGPYHQQELEEYLHPNSIYMNSIIIANAANMRMMTPIQSEVFCPKKLTLKDEIQDKRYHYLKNGIAEGPLKEAEVKELIKTKQLLFSDLISEDNGSTWQKIFEYKIFNNNLKEKLPNLEMLSNITDKDLLDGEVKTQATTSHDKNIENLTERNDQLLGLVKLSHRNHDSNPLIDTNVEINNENTTIDRLNEFLPKLVVLTMIILVGMFSAYFYYSFNKGIPSIKKTKKITKLEWKNNLNKKKNTKYAPKIKLTKKRNKPSQQRRPAQMQVEANRIKDNPPSQRRNKTRNISGKYNNAKNNIQNEVKEEDLPYDLVDYNEYEYDSMDERDEESIENMPAGNSRRFTLEEIQQIRNMPIEFLEEE
jgi:hypothetical protein